MKTQNTVDQLGWSSAFGERSKDILERFVNALRRTLPVEEIWLFGSGARGEIHADSDLDLLVVLSDNHGMARPNLACYQAIGHLPNRPPVDVLAISKSQWGFEKANPFGLYGEISQRGQKLYEKRST